MYACIHTKVQPLRSLDMLPASRSKARWLVEASHAGETEWWQHRHQLGDQSLSNNTGAGSHCPPS